MPRVLPELLLALFTLLLSHQAANAEVQRKKFTSPAGYLIIEVLDDDLMHFEVSVADEGPSEDQALYTSPMVLKADYGGPSDLTSGGNVVETPDIRAEVNTDNLCVRLEDKTKANAHLTTLCPAELHLPFKGLDIDPGQIRHVYGLGQEFKNRGSADGDWTALGIRQGLELLGNGFQGFQDAAVGNVQIPVLYAVGDDNLNYALMLDNIYKQKWDFTAFWWEARMFGDQLRFYVMTGPDLPNLRADYMELTGRPPIPPRKSFGLWVSEFGYDNWGQIDMLKAELRSNDFPIDGFVLDLNWFGGVVIDQPSESEMGRLDWDRDQEQRLTDNSYFFPDPASRIQQYAEDHIGLVAIEESYIANTTDTFEKMPDELTAYRRTNGQCDPANQSQAAVDVRGFWGVGRMIDWTDPEAGAWIHDERRFPNLVDLGITSHWTDLGEPETFDRAACYNGVEVTSAGHKNEHSDVHNLHNLMWNKAIWDGYVAKQGEENNLGQVNPRPFIVTRSGTAGTQRYGAAMWSGDIASNLESLATHMNAQMHMSFSGIDYYGSDIGGFRREVMPYNNKLGAYREYQDELYTQWFANGAWFDVPVRPHTDNEFVQVSPPYATAPHLVGKKDSNLANIRQRYELIPYYYSLAYRAHLNGEPVMPPIVFYHQNDPNARRVGNEKLIGKDLLVGIVAQHGEYERDVYLPAGKWANYHTNEWINSTGQTLENVPVYRDGIFRLPAFVRASAIIPQMHVDEDTKDALGSRKDGAVSHDELIVRVYAGSMSSSFTLYEDDGRTLEYEDNGRPWYRHRRTEISQQQTGGNAVTVTLQPAVDVNGNGPFGGAVNERQNIVELVVDGAEAVAVSLNGTPLTQHTLKDAFAAASSGWYNAGSNLILAKSESMNVYDTTKMFSFDLRPVTPSTSVNFVCDRGFTVPGVSVYVVGNISALGGPDWDTARAIKLDPNVYYGYIVNPPPGHLGPGPSAPVWTGIVADIPPNTMFEWKCIRKRDDGTGESEWEPGDNNIHSTTASGYTGRAYGTF